MSTAGKERGFKRFSIKSTCSTIGLAFFIAPLTAFLELQVLAFHIAYSCIWVFLSFYLQLKKYQELWFKGKKL